MTSSKHTRKNSHTLHTLRVALMCVLPGLSLLIPAAARTENTFTSMVPVDDSVALKTDVYIPSEPGKFPAVLIRTPYRGDWLAIAAQRFADRGYVAVVQSVRGMNESQGQFIPFVNEHSDGLATVEWVTSQPWSDGQVALWGASYLSHCAFEIARSDHPALKAMVNISGWAELTPFLTRGGALRLLDQLPWLMEYAGGQSQIPDQAWEGIFRTTPLSNFFGGHDEIEKVVEEAYDYSSITVPIMHITGWNDYICRNTLEAYHRTKSESGRAESRLILGPWTHNQMFDPDSTKYGDADFGPTSPLGIDSILSLSITWFDQNVKGLETGLNAEAPVKYFMQGENRWHTSATWPPARVSQKMLYLISDNGDALLQHAAPKGEATMSFDYNPHNPVPTIGGAVSFKHPFNVGVKDQSSLEGREDILFFESSVLDAPLNLVGSISVELYASTDSIDTDFTAKLVEVRSDGYARLIEDGIIRTRYGRNPDSTIFVAANTVQRYHIDLGETAYRVEAGSRLRLEISSGNFPKFDRNPNDGTDPMTTTDFRIAHQKIHLSEKHPSRLMLSVMD